MIQEVSRIGRRGTLVVPAALRRRFGLTEGTLVAAEERADGILLRPAVVVPIEAYSDRRRAEFLLNNAVDAADYQAAVTAVREMGLDPADIPQAHTGEGR
jgi:AbrB family looped-hinge helix DNA binding protein